MDVFFVQRANKIEIMADSVMLKFGLGLSRQCYGVVQLVLGLA